MLLDRSILFELCLVLVAVSQVKCQYDYSVAEEAEDHSDFTDDAEHESHPDYSKYYSVDTSAPLVQAADAGNGESSGFVSPIEFTSFFASSPIAFGASTNQEVTKPAGFVSAPKSNPLEALKADFTNYYEAGPFPKDFFEESQRQQQLEKQQEEESSPDSSIKPGPSYVSHQLPRHSNYEGDDEGESADYRRTPSDDEVETIRPVKKHKKKPKKPKDYDYESNSGKDYYLDEYIPTSPAPLKNNKYTDYNIGKSSSTVSQVPTATGLRSSTLSPYQKYSFQPTGTTEGFESKYLDSFVTTVAPFNPNLKKVITDANVGQPTENVPSHLKGKNCRKIQKPVSESESMNCYVCEDAENKSKYTQCSYTSEPEPINYYAGASERYSTPARGPEPDGFRYKRYTDEESAADDPYSYIKKRSQKAYDEPTDSEKYHEEYHYSPVDYYNEEETHPEKSFSELQSEEIRKNPANCKKIEKSGMTCTICKNEKTGGNYEQCSYTSEPKEQKYAYITEKKYDSEEPEESKPVVKTQQISSVPVENSEKPQQFGQKIPSITKDFEPIEEFDGRIRNNKRPERQNSRKRNEESRESEKSSYQKKESGRSSRPAPKNSKKVVDDDRYDFAQASNDDFHHGGLGLDPALYGADPHDEQEQKREKEGKEKKTKSNNEYKDIEEYHFKLFPEFENEESRQEEVNHPADASRQDVEDVLAEFTKKDRSNCKKAEKNGMTCYLCVDQNKIQHEECMYVSESKPKATHVAYHEEQKFKSPEEKKPLQEESKKIEQKVSSSTTTTTTTTTPIPESKRKRFFKKASVPELELAASEEIDKVLKYKPKKVNKNIDGRKNVKKTNKNADEPEPTIETPAEFTVGDDEGAFSAETKPVYSKTLNVRLPRYMIEKSEFEKEFDEFSGLKLD